MNHSKKQEPGRTHTHRSHSYRHHYLLLPLQVILPSEEKSNQTCDEHVDV